MKNVLSGNAGLGNANPSTPCSMRFDTTETNQKLKVQPLIKSDQSKKQQQHPRACTAVGRTDKECYYRMMMKAAQVHRFVTDFGSAESLADSLTITTNVPRPIPTKSQILVRVLACSISPGDAIMVHGNLIFLHQPFPFVPGMDICGVVVEEPDNDKQKKKISPKNAGPPLFRPGDIVVASNGIAAVGGLAEYMAVDVKEAVHKPADVGILEAAASSSAITARNAVMDHVKSGDRVLILGGSGGVGSAALQLAKHIVGASYVATTSTQEELCAKLGADRVIDYRTEDWWDMKHYDQKLFDVIIDCVGGPDHYGHAPAVLKPAKAGGTFVAVTGDDPLPDCRTWWRAIQFFFHLPWRPLYAWWHGRTLPKYVMIMPYDIPQGRAQVLQWMADGRLSIPLDGDPFPFTDDGVRAAFGKIGTGHAHGKVVVAVQPQ
jgi:NADPH:quinone reductase-like Zn-dependent oxidoreductase